ncbi:MAG: GSCFA domain-containing protein [Rikenellaceae bacterium]|nr:GSCFA domain-containing protein [Rikenellaceae bacterium]
MKFRTEIKIAPFARPIDHAERILSLGSCFAEAMTQRLQGVKFHAEGNFAGPLFNPEVIADAIERAASGYRHTAAEMQPNSEGLYFSFDGATHLAAPTAEEAAARINEADEDLRRALSEADTLIVTFGTAWVYRHLTSGKIVANCHRQAASEFERERLTIEGIVARWRSLLEGPLREKRILLTVSPIRHLKDGLEQNTVSKAILRLAIEELCEKHPQCSYFPAYELLLDDLRDYRFYAEDLTHPAPQAVEYIWERFSQAAFTPQTRQLNDRITRALSFCAHRPLNPASESYRKAAEHLCTELAELQQATGIDFSEEIASLKAKIQTK